MRRNNRIQITGGDAARLRAILATREADARDRDHLLDLRDELERARVVAEDEMPADVVTLRSRVRVRDEASGASSDYEVVPPTLADVSTGRISVLAPLGTALLGYREGDDVEWPMPGGMRRLRIQRVWQPQQAHSTSGAASTRATPLVA